MLDENFRIVCADGFSFSINISPRSYSSKDTNGEFVEVEVGYLSGPDKLFAPYIEEDENPSESIFPYVPVDTVAEVVFMHGGQVFPDPLDENSIVFVDQLAEDQALTTE